MVVALWLCSGRLEVGLGVGTPVLRKRRPTEAERITVCVLAALEHALTKAAANQGVTISPFGP